MPHEGDACISVLLCSAGGGAVHGAPLCHQLRLHQDGPQAVGRQDSRTGLQSL